MRARDERCCYPGEGGGCGEYVGRDRGVEHFDPGVFAFDSRRVGARARPAHDFHPVILGSSEPAGILKRIAVAAHRPQCSTFEIDEL